MKKKCITIFVAIETIAFVVLLIVFLSVISKSSAHNSSNGAGTDVVVVQGTVIGKFTDCFVIKTKYVSSNQVFYTFRVTDDTTVVDSNGNSIKFSDIRLNSEIEVVISNIDYDYFTYERHEFLPARVRVESAE